MNNLTTTERAWIIRKLHSNIAEYFAHWEDADFSRDQLDDIYRAYLTEALCKSKSPSIAEESTILLQKEKRFE